jgi:hypothetical protein
LDGHYIRHNRQTLPEPYNSHGLVNEIAPTKWPQESTEDGKKQRRGLESAEKQTASNALKSSICRNNLMQSELGSTEE